MCHKQKNQKICQQRVEIHPIFLATYPPEHSLIASLPILYLYFVLLDWKKVKRKQGQYISAYAQILISLCISPRMDCSWGSLLVLGWSVHYALLTSYEYIVQSYMGSHKTYLNENSHSNIKCVQQKKLSKKAVVSVITDIFVIVIVIVCARLAPCKTSTSCY